MALTPREIKVVQRYLVDGCTLPELRRELKDSRTGRMLPVRRVKQIVAKTGRKALFYNKHWEECGAADRAAFGQTQKE